MFQSTACSTFAKSFILYVWEGASYDFEFLNWSLKSEKSTLMSSNNCGWYVLQAKQLVLNCQWIYLIFAKTFMPVFVTRWLTRQWILKLHFTSSKADRKCHYHLTLNKSISIVRIFWQFIKIWFNWMTHYIFWSSGVNSNISRLGWMNLGGAFNLAYV